MEILTLQQLSGCGSPSGFHGDFSDRNKKYRGFFWVVGRKCVNLQSERRNYRNDGARSYHIAGLEHESGGYLVNSDLSDILCLS